jgi:hypothetical protein
LYDIHDDIFLNFLFFGLFQNSQNKLSKFLLSYQFYASKLSLVSVLSLMLSNLYLPYRSLLPTLIVTHNPCCLVIQLDNLLYSLLLLSKEGVLLLIQLHLQSLNSSLPITLVLFLFISFLVTKFTWLILFHQHLTRDFNFVEVSILIYLLNQ